MINIPAVTVHHVAGVDSEKKDAPVSVTSDTDEMEPDDELDPARLKKAFRFAVLSSVIMVCIARTKWHASDR